MIEALVICLAALVGLVLYLVSRVWLWILRCALVVLPVVIALRILE